MARRPQFSDEDLLDAARAVFIARGTRATTAEVAERAGVSEGTIFHHFKTKEALFRAALHPKRDEPPEISGLEARVGQGEVGENVREFATSVLDWLRARLPLLMLAWAEADAKERQQLMCDADPINARAVRVLAGYLEAESRLGRLRRVDAEIAARVVLGSLFDYVRAEIVEGGRGGLPLPAPMFVRGLVDIFLHGMTPPARGKKRAAARAHH
ncbi:MAG: TetR/AcrR family transcriptional regulator [Deltaproteobacteria bacterium]|nr:TetR/AcrR family transcriptional regulator [Deltaproteobacteria bacterium]